MPVQNENRECLVCEQYISPGDDSVTVKLHPFNRIVHPTCAEKVAKALDEYNEEDSEEQPGDEEVRDDDIDDISDEDVE